MLIFCLHPVHSNKKKSYKLSNEEIYYVNSLIDEVSKSEGVLDVNQSSTSIKCPPNKPLVKFFETLTPDDYDQANMSDINRRVDHINITIERLERLQMFSQNMSKTFDPIIKRIVSRISEILFENQLPNECMTDLIRIGSGIHNKKTWALKCKLKNIYGFLNNLKFESKIWKYCLLWDRHNSNHL